MSWNDKTKEEREKEIAEALGKALDPSIDGIPESEPAPSKPEEVPSGVFYQPTEEELAMSREEILAEVKLVGTPSTYEEKTRLAWLSNRFNVLREGPAGPPPKGRPPTPGPTKTELKVQQDTISIIRKQLRKHRELVMAELDRFEQQVEKRLSRLENRVD